MLWTFAAVHSDRDIDDFRPDRADRRIVQPGPLDRPGPQVLDEDVRLRKQVEKDLRARKLTRERAVAAVATWPAR